MLNVVGGENKAGTIHCSELGYGNPINVPSTELRFATTIGGWHKIGLYVKCLKNYMESEYDFKYVLKECTEKVYDIRSEKN